MKRACLIAACVPLSGVVAGVILGLAVLPW